MRFVFKSGAKQDIGAEDAWYALNNGYLKPEDILTDPKQIIRLKKAVQVVDAFIEQCYNTGVIDPVHR